MARTHPKGRASVRRVLALDLATRTGWALLLGDTLSTGFVRFGRSGKGDRDRLRAIEEWLPGILLPIACDQGDLVYELTGFGFRNSIRISGHLEAFLIRAADTFGIPENRVCTYTPMQAKKSATGSGAASKEKVLLAMRERWGKPDLDDKDESDALALLHHHLLQGKPNA